MAVLEEVLICMQAPVVPADSRSTGRYPSVGRARAGALSLGSKPGSIVPAEDPGGPGELPVTFGLAVEMIAPVKNPLRGSFTP